MDELDMKIILELANNRMNVCEVARVLFTHRNTVNYHTKKIMRVTGLNPLDFYDLYKLVEMVREIRNGKQE